MFGRSSGVQKRIAQVVPQAIYMHCFAHVLNLVLIDSTKKVSEACNFFALLEMVYVFLSSSEAQSLFEKHQSTLYLNQPKFEIKRLSDTRWACRYSAVDTLCRRFNVVIVTLEDIAKDFSSPKRAVEANGLLLQTKCFKFILTLIIFDRILSSTMMLSDSLQARNCDLAKATSLVSAAIETFEGFRCDSYWEHLYLYAEFVAKVQLPSAGTSRPKRHQTDYKIV